MEKEIEREEGHHDIHTPFLVRLDRVAAWTLFFVIIAYVITGFGMTKGIMDGKMAHEFHLEYLGAIGVVAFTVHTSFATSLILKRKRLWNSLTKYLLVVFYVLMASAFFYLQFFYEEDYQNIAGQSDNIQFQDNGKMVDGEVFTAEKLAEYDGKNGSAAYVAVDGVVYDLSEVFRNGTHHGYSAGQDLSEVFHREHSDNYLDGYEIVGSYEE